MSSTDEHKPREKTIEELKKFGLTMTTAFVLLGGLLLWRGKLWGIYLLYAATVFLILEVIAPKALGPIEKVWLAFGEKIGAVMSVVILSIAFYLVLTPLGLILRLLGKDLLSIKLDPKRESYWEPAEVDGPQTRPFLPY